MYTVIYLLCFTFSVFLAWRVTKRIIDNTVNGGLVTIIKILTGLAITCAIYGMFFLIIHAYVKPFQNPNPELSIKSENEIPKDKDNLNKQSSVNSGKQSSEIGVDNLKRYLKEDKIKEIEKNQGENTSIVHYEVDSDFDLNTLEFNQKTVQTATIFFTIAGLALGTLGVFWLAHIETTRLEKDRKHDQEVQKDRLLSLLSLGIDLFKYIDKEELDFVYECDKSYTNERCISWEGKRYYFLTSQIVEKNKDLEIEYQRHITSIYKFLYEQKSFKKNTILSDIHKIIDELKILYYEKDLILFDEKDNQNKEKRAIFIKLLKQYNDYNNFLLGNTIESDFSVNEYKLVEKKLSTLLNNEKIIEPIEYLKEKYENKSEIFFDYFCEKISKEFTENYLVKQSDILTIFQANSLDGIFKIMSISHLDASKFFIAYFSDSFKKYILNKKEYMHINLKYKDLKFDEYLTIMQNSFSQIHADIESVKELYTLFDSFVELYENYKGNK